MKADLCSAWSGQKAELYTGNEKARKAVISATKEYLKSKEVSAPSPFVTLLIAIALYAGPGIALAGWHKYQIKKQKRNTETKIIELHPNKSKAKDYSNLKEVKEGRRLFTIHKTKGTYNKKPNGDFWYIDDANEEPSPEIQQLIDEGKKCPEIRSILYGE